LRKRTAGLPIVATLRGYLRPRMRLYPSLAVLILFVLVAELFGSSCANIVPPNGGPRDSIPPRLINASPKDSTVNFKGERITLTFDEYVDLQDVPNNLIFSPLFQTNPRVEVKGKTITVNFRDSLEANTTYIFNFGNAIRDFNEGNILKGYTYTFSTGPALDSLELSGRVLLAQTGGVDSTITVVLHGNLKDSAVQNQTPRYAVRVDQQGRFRFRNLSAGRYAIYALGDAGTSRRYLRKDQLFAFADSAVTVAPGRQDSAGAITLYAYKEIQPNTNTPATAGAATARPGGAANRLVFTTNLANNVQDLVNPLVLSFATPLRTVDSTQLLLFTDSTFRPATYRFTLDSTRKQLSLRSEWQANTRYNLVLNRDFATDTAGRKLLKSDTLFFNTKKLEDYGNLTVRLKNVEAARNPVLLLLQNEQVVISASIRSGSFSQKFLAPGEYDVRILYDTNGNGKWDPGQFFGTKRQPELIKPVERKITIKPNWDNEYEL
jgi:uncharacterized protein (DUF2141 family)